MFGSVKAPQTFADSVGCILWTEKLSFTQGSTDGSDQSISIVMRGATNALGSTHSLSLLLSARWCNPSNLRSLQGESAIKPFWLNQNSHTTF
jgi:hypothetical protein